MKCLLLSLLVTASCYDECYVQRYDWGFSYNVEPNIVTEYGIKVDTSKRVYPDKVFSLMDRMTQEVESCLNKKVDKQCLRVKIPRSWFTSEYTGHQLLKDKAPMDACIQKDLDPDKGCYWRAGLQDGYKVITTPNLYLYKDPLVKFVTGEEEVWVKYPECVSPGIEHDWMTR